jgi:predicted ATP-grasp superfamily ATP-dependent carboligase
MKYTITTYDTNGNEIVSRICSIDVQDQNLQQAREMYADQIESILEDSAQYLEEQALDNKEDNERNQI